MVKLVSAFLSFAIGCLLLSFPIPLWVSTATAAQTSPALDIAFLAANHAPVSSSTFDAYGNQWLITSYFLSDHPSGIVDIDPNAGVVNVSLLGAYNAIIVKLDTNGNYAAYRYLGYSETYLLPPYEHVGGIISMHIAVSGDTVYVAGRIISSPFILVTDAGAQPIAAGQDFEHPQSVFVRYTPAMTMNDFYDFSGLSIHDIEPKPDGGFYVGYSLHGEADLDFMTDGTTLFAPAFSPSEDGIFASYGPDGQLNFVYRYDSPDAESQNRVTQIETYRDRVYVLLAYNSNSAPAVLDIDPSPNTVHAALHEHDPLIIVFDHSGRYIWHHVVSSAPLYGQYAFVDDENGDQFALDAQGNVYVTLYSDSDAVQIGTAIYHKRITGINNVYESFLYKISAEGEVVWSKYFPSNGSSSVYSTKLLYDPASKRLVVFYTLEAGGFTIDTTSITHNFQGTREMIALFDENGSLQTHYFFPLSGSGTLRREIIHDALLWTDTAEGNSRLFINYALDAAGYSFNPDFVHQSAASETVQGDVWYNLMYSLQPIP